MINSSLTMTSTSLINHLKLTSNGSNSTLFNMTTTTTSRKPFYLQGQEIIQRRLKNLDRGILTNVTILLVCLTCLILIFISIKTFILRKRRQNRRYKLLSRATRMEEPLFNSNHDEEEEREDDTLFIRK